MHNRNPLVRLAVLLLTLLLTLPVLCIQADNSATISADTVTAEPGETIQIKVSISSNPGFIGFSVALGYDTSVFTYEKVDYLPDYNGKSAKFSATNVTGKCGYPVLAQCTFDPSKEEGYKSACTLFVVTLKVAENAKDGRYKMTPTVETTNRTGTIYGWDSVNNKDLTINVTSVSGAVLIGDVSDEPSDLPSGTVDPVDPGKTSDVTSEKTSDVDPGKTSEKTSDVTSEGGKTDPIDPGKTSDVTSDVTSEKASDVTSEKTSDVTSEATSDVTSEKTSDVTSDIPSDVTSGATSGETSDVTSENTSGSSEKGDPTGPEIDPKPRYNTPKTLLLVGGIVLLTAAAGIGIWKLIPVIKKKKENRE